MVSREQPRQRADAGWKQHGPSEPACEPPDRRSNKEHGSGAKNEARGTERSEREGRAEDETDLGVLGRGIQRRIDVQHTIAEGTTDQRR